MKILNSVIFVLTEKGEFKFEKFEIKHLKFDATKFLNKVHEYNYYHNDKIKFILIEIFKGIHSFIFTNVLTKENTVEYEYNDLYNFSNEKDYQEFLNKCFENKLDFNNLRYKLDKDFENLLN
jgi:hypothetical protein